MTFADAALALFTLFNALRVVAYLPQIVKIWHDTSGAGAISYTTWTLFGASHFSTVAYAVLTMHDWKMAAVFAANGACCTIILGLTAYKRSQLGTKGSHSAFLLRAVSEIVPKPRRIQGNAAS